MSKCVMFAETYRLSLKNYFQRHSLKLDKFCQSRTQAIPQICSKQAPEMNKETEECQSPPERHWASTGYPLLHHIVLFSAHSVLGYMELKAKQSEITCILLKNESLKAPEIEV